MTHRVGQQIAGYCLVQYKGSGASGDVYLAESILAHDNRPVAVKLLNLKLTSPREVKAFINEASMIFRLTQTKHPHIVQLLAFDIAEDDTPFLVMTYASHGTLLKRHPRGTPLPLPVVVSYVKQLASALQYAHDQHVIHRDIKPENILLGENDEILLSDFGIAVVAHNTSTQRTEDIVGTWAYMAPEQLQGKPRPASDQYALGIVTYEWLCGERPFRGYSS